MKKYVRIVQTEPFSPGGDTSTRLDLSRLPLESGGRELYVEAIRMRLRGSAAVSGDEALTLPAGRRAKLFRRLMLEVPEVEKPLLEISGIEKARLHRVMHRGRRLPGTDALSTTGTTGIPIDVTITHNFGYSRARRSKDFSLPARVLRDATFRIEWGELKDLHERVTSINATLEVVCICQPRAEVQRPSVVIEESLELEAGPEPKVTPVAGKVTHLFLGGRGGTVLDSDELTELGLSFGSHRISEHSQDPSVFYAEFNEGAWPLEEIENHLTGQTDEDAVLPIVFDPQNMSGQRLTHDTVNGALPVALRMAAPPAKTTLTRRVVLYRGGWTERLNAKSGVRANREPKTASHKRTASDEVASVLPDKATLA